MQFDIRHGVQFPSFLFTSNSICQFENGIPYTICYMKFTFNSTESTNQRQKMFAAKVFKCSA